MKKINIVLLCASGKQTRDNDKHVLVPYLSSTTDKYLCHWFF